MILLVSLAPSSAPLSFPRSIPVCYGRSNFSTRCKRGSLNSHQLRRTNVRPLPLVPLPGLLRDSFHIYIYMLASSSFLFPLRLPLPFIIPLYIFFSSLFFSFFFFSVAFFAHVRLSRLIKRIPRTGHVSRINRICCRTREIIRVANGNCSGDLTFKNVRGRGSNYTNSNTSVLRRDDFEDDCNETVL